NIFNEAGFYFLKKQSKHGGKSRFRNFSITPCRKQDWESAFQGFRRINAPAFSALPPSMAVENRDVLSERTGMYSQRR
ncbi:MAG: hypothetical protein U9Q75_04305, partial [Pseudomonadota bacterium]|nr:hypothetical protein [Pseudomonadota bacterium]